MKNNTQQNTKIVKGDIFDYWTVIDATILKIKSEAGRTNYFVTCQCKCGTINKVRTTALLTNKSKGCRCRSTDKLRETLEYVGDISQTFWSRQIKSAKNRNIQFNLTKEYAWNLFVKQNKKCALTGCDLILNKSISRVKGANTITASIDRIDSTLGYIEGNIQWVHKDINKLKQDWDQNYFIQMCTSVASFSKNLQPNVRIAKK